MGGVQVGLNVSYSFGTRTSMTAEDCLDQCVKLNISGVELRAQAIEKSFGLPDNLVLGPAPSDYIAAGLARAKSQVIPQTRCLLLPQIPWLAIVQEAPVCRGHLRSLRRTIPQPRSWANGGSLSQ
jgi:hypothetical protein